MAMTFTLTDEQEKKFNKWRKSKGEIYVGAIGGAYEFIFLPTGIGTVKIVRCADGTELDLTTKEDFG